MPLEELFGDRDRAVGFGAVAERYEQYRSGYPDSLIADLVSSGCRTALDVGCGTGKLAVALHRSGVHVLGVDPDERMAAVARRHGVPVEVSGFERWADGGRSFDLVTSGHAWHWIDPAPGLAKVARLLVPGGLIARCWNYHAVDDELLSEFRQAYHRFAPGVDVIGSDASVLPKPDDPFARSALFEATSDQTYRWTREMSANEWTGLISTFGDHLRLPAGQFAQLAESLRIAIARSGGTVHVRGGTYLQVARRAADERHG
jgi:SAM-dependent methyltransferase